jgi:para-nitrobenzyl esterase
MTRSLTAIVCVLCFALHGCGGGGVAAPQPIDSPPPEPGPSDDPLVVMTSKGEVRGVEDGLSQAFLGVPYAKPPTGERRWDEPQPTDPWNDTLDASAFAPVCPQTEQPGSPTVIGDEDCLYLHLWRPASAAEDPQSASLPVLVFLHGGGNYFGGATQPMDELLNGVDPEALLYNGAGLAANGNVIVVTVNYRLAALGYLAHPALSANADTGTSGNYGIMDQQMALRWVKDEIRAFGGNPQDVMLFGQSGGARNTCSLLASPLSAGLFQRVGLHSGSCANPPRSQIEDRSTTFILEMGCAGAADVVGCLRAVPVENIVRALSAIPNGGGLGIPAFAPTVDDRVLLESPDRAIAAGRHNAVPMIVGANSAEYAHEFFDIPADELAEFLGTLMPAEFVDEALTVYDPAFYGDSPTAAFVAAYSDRNIVCNMLRTADLLVGSQTEPVFFYLFDQTLTTPARLAAGAYHTTELLYLFQHPIDGPFSATADERLVAADMAGYWSTMAATGRMDAPGLGEWQPYRSADRNYLRLQPTPVNETELRDAQCAFWGRVREN